MQIALPISTSKSTSGYLAMCMTLLIWTGFALSIRAIGHSTLLPIDVAFIRFGLPCLLLLPYWKSSWRAIKNANKIALFLIPFGAGVPFFLLASLGAKMTSAAHVGALISGTVPLFVTLICVLFWKQQTSQQRLIGLGFILLGILGMLWRNQTGHQITLGILILLISSILWSLYTVGIRLSQLDAIACNLLLCVPSFVICAIALSFQLTDSHLLHSTLSDIAPFFLLQGIGVGVVSGLCYGFAIKEIGAEKSALIGSLTPALTALLSVPILHESLSAAVLIGVVLITIGVSIANKPSR